MARRGGRDEGSSDHPLYRRVGSRVPRLARRMVETFVEEIPLYAVLPREQLHGEILDITEANLRLFFSALREGRALTDDELGDIRTSAARRAEERVPLDAVLTAYHVGGGVGRGGGGGNAGTGGKPALIPPRPPGPPYLPQGTPPGAPPPPPERQ